MDDNHGRQTFLNDTSQALPMAPSPDFTAPCQGIQKRYLQLSFIRDREAGIQVQKVLIG